MRNMLYALLLCLPLGASAKPLDIEKTYYRSKVVYEMWMEACYYTKYTCGLTPVPKVKRETMRRGLLGQYRGGDTIYINRRLVGIPLKEVLMHEMVHYIQTKVGGLKVPGRAEPICRAEAEAFTTVDEWLVDNGYGYLVVGKNWWKPYQHCWRWYDPKWPSYSPFERFIWSIGI